HVRLALSLGPERIVPRAEETRRSCIVRMMLHPRLQSDEYRKRRVGRSENFRNRGAERWPAAGRLVLFAAAGHAHEIAVVIDRVCNRADDRELVSDTGNEREMLANLDAWHLGGDGPEFTANFRRRIQLQIESILMWRSARQVSHNYLLLGP